MSPPVALPCSRLDDKIIGQTTGGGKFQISLASIQRHLSRPCNAIYLGDRFIDVCGNRLGFFSLLIGGGGEMLSVRRTVLNLTQSFQRYPRVHGIGYSYSNGSYNYQLVSQSQKAPFLRKCSMALGFVGTCFFCAYGILGLILANRHFGRKLLIALAGLIASGLVFYSQWENPRLCRGGSSSLTFPGVHPETLRREPPSTPQGETGWTSMQA